MLFRKGQTWTGVELVLPSSGSSGNSIIYGSFGTGDRPIIDGNNAAARNLSTNGKSYITIQDLEFKRATVFGIRVNGGSNITLSNLVIHDNKYEGVRLNATNVTVSGGYIYDNGGTANHVGIWFSGDVSGAVINGVELFDTGSSKQLHGLWTFEATGSGYITVSNCYIHDHPKYGADLMSLNGYQIIGNTFKNNGWGSTTTSGSFTYRDGNMRIHDGAHNSLIEKNIFEGGYGWGVDSYLSTNNTYRYNLFINNYDRDNSPVGPGIGLEINSSLGGKVYNNTFYGNTIGLQVTYESGQGVETSITLTNNIFYNNTTQDYYKYPSDHSSITAVTNLTGINPLFIDAAGNNFQLQSTSPAINAGTTIGLTSDFLSNPVPNGTVPDLGAYEWFSPTSGSSLVSTAISSGVTSTSVCTAPAPVDTLVINKIDAANDSATVVFTTAKENVSGYAISYGETSDANSYATIVNYTGPLWLLETTINSLKQNTTYYFKVKPVNGCTGGHWSPILSTKTSFSEQSVELVSSPPSDGPLIPTPNPTTEPLTVSPQQETYSLRVKVTDSHSTPIVGASVTIHSKVQTALTDQKGVASFTGVESGTHRVRISYQNSSVEREINVSASSTQDITVQLDATSNSLARQSFFLLLGILVMGGIIGVAYFSRRKQ